MKKTFTKMLYIFLGTGASKKGHVQSILGLRFPNSHSILLPFSLIFFIFVVVECMGCLRLSGHSLHFAGLCLVVEATAEASHRKSIQNT